MPIREIVRLGHPALRAPAELVEPAELKGAEVQQLIDDMIETMRDAGGVGLAAPQVGVGLQIFVYEVVAAETDEVLTPLRVVINPMIDAEAGELVYDWEGCLSISGLRGLVPRHPALRIRALGRDGEPQDFRVEGFEARVAQHEFDHLNGIVFLDRMRDLRSLAYEEELQRYFMEGEDDEVEVAAAG